MKKKFIFSLFAIAFAGALLIVALAHSGRTDSKGGHYNRSTGEYHYHHGYSAHDHYDMDGDGMDDCPYTFKRTEATTASTKRTQGKQYYLTDSGRVVEKGSTAKSSATAKAETAKIESVRAIAGDMLSYVLNLKISELPIHLICLGIIAFLGYYAAVLFVGNPFILWCEFTKRKFNEQTINKMIAVSSIIIDIAIVLYVLYDKVK